MRESQASIVAWANQTFGPAASTVRVVARANEEMAELLRAITWGAEPSKIAVEAADVAIVLCRAAAAVNEMPLFSNAAAARSEAPLKPALHANRAIADLLLEIDRSGGGAEFFVARLITRAFFFLHRVCEAAGSTLAEEVDSKMAINRARTWNLDGSGHGYHVRADQDAA